VALSDLARLRLLIADRARLVLHETVGLGDGLTLAFQTRGAPIFLASEAVVVISGSLTTVLYPGADYTLDYDLGLLRLNVAPADGERVQVAYRWAAFSDAELTDLLAQAGSVSGAAVLALQALLADADRWIKYTLGQETVDRIAARDAVLSLIEQLKADRAGVGGLVQADSDYRLCLMAPFVEQECEA
jgi:hypothetical protein